MVNATAAVTPVAPAPLTFNVALAFSASTAPAVDRRRAQRPPAASLLAPSARRRTNAPSQAAPRSVETMDTKTTDRSIAAETRAAPVQESATALTAVADSIVSTESALTTRRVALPSVLSVLRVDSAVSHPAPQDVTRTVLMLTDRSIVAETEAGVAPRISSVVAACGAPTAYVVMAKAQRHRPRAVRSGLAGSAQAPSNAVRLGALSFAMTTALPAMAHSTAAAMMAADVAAERTAAVAWTAPKGSVAQLGPLLEARVEERLRLVEHVLPTKNARAQVSAGTTASRRTANAIAAFMMEDRAEVILSAALD